MRLRHGWLIWIAASATLLLGAAPASAAVRKLTLRDTGVTGTAFRTDGERYIALATSAAEVTVIDVRGGAQPVLPIPAGCEFADIHHGSLLWSCDQPPNVCCGVFDTGIVQSIATGTRRMLPRAPVHANDYVSEGGHWAELGDRIARSTYAGYHIFGSLYTDLATGRARRVADQPRQRRAARRAAAHPPPVLGPAAPARQRRQRPGAHPRPVGDRGALGGPPLTYTKRDTFGRVQLQRCGQRTRTLRRCRTTFCSEPVVDERVVAWEERARRSPYSVTLSVTARHRPATARCRPALTDGSYGLSPLLVAGRLYVVRTTPLGSQPLAPVQLCLMRVVL